MKTSKNLVGISNWNMFTVLCALTYV